MNRAMVLSILFAAAVLEAGGDALIRHGLRASGGIARVVFFALGAAVLFGYGYAVNAPGWDFGRLLGIYVVFFFVVAQSIAWIFFQERPGNAMWLGGACIVAGGLIISFGAR